MDAGQKPVENRNTGYMSTEHTRVAPTEQAMLAAEAVRPDVADMAKHHPQESERTEGMRRMLALASAIDSASGLPSLLAERDALRAALERAVKRYVDMANSGDCGNWDPEEEEFVIAARAALALGGKGQQ